MLSMCQRMRLEKRTVVILGAGWHSKQQVFNVAQKLGMNIIVVDENAGDDHPVFTGKKCIDWIKVCKRHV